MNPERPLLIDAREAGKLLGMPWYRVTRLARQGSLPHVLMPNDEPRFSADELRAWVEKHRLPAPDAEGCCHA